MTGGTGTSAAISGGVLALVLAITGVAGFVAATGLREIVRRREWRDGATAGLLLALLTNSLVDLIVSFAGPQWTTTQDAFGNRVTALPLWAHTIQMLFYGVILVGALVVVMTRIARRGSSVNLPALLLLLVALLSGGSAALHGDNPLRPFYVVTLAILAATTLAPRGPGVVIGLGTFFALGLVSAGLTTAFVPEFSTLACDTVKCGLLGFNFRGYFDNENAFALFCCLAMPFVYLAFGPVRGSVLAAYVLFLVLLSGSRSGAFAGTVTFIMLLIARPDLRRPTFSLPRVAVLYSTLGAAGVVGVLLPFTVQDPHGFTERAYLWMLARSALSGPTELLVGNGSLAWEHVRDAGVIDFSALYSVHNQWLQILYTTGLVGAVLTVAALFLLIRQAGRRHLAVVGCVLVPAVCLAITERPWSMDYVDWLSWALPGALLCYPLRPRLRETSGEASGPSAEPKPFPLGPGDLESDGPSSAETARSGAGPIVGDTKGAT